MITTPWRVQLFGKLRAQYQDVVVSRFRTQKTGALLAYLAFYRQRAHPREALIELCWPDAEIESGRVRSNARREPRPRGPVSR